MSKKKRNSAPANSQKAAEREDKGPTLKDLLSADVLNRLKLQSDELKAAEEKRKEEANLQAEEARKQEQKRLENDMAYLLDNNKQDWRKFK